MKPAVINCWKYSKELLDLFDLCVICEVSLKIKQFKIIVIDIFLNTTGLVSVLSFGSFIFPCVSFDFSQQDVGI